MEAAGRSQPLETQDSAVSFCPSFNTYSSEKFAEIAARVTEECTTDAKLSAHAKSSNDLGVGDEDDDFEFTFVRSDADVSADEIFRDGGAREVFPVFNRDLLAHYNQDSDAKRDVQLQTLRLPLGKLFIEERDPPSSSSSEADELEGVPSGTYCVWRPKVVDDSPSRCKKSNSTGSASKRWKFLDLLRRSNSDGKDAFVFLTPKNREQKAGKFERVESSKDRRSSYDAGKVAGKVKAKGTSAGGEKASSSAHEEFYIRNRASKEGDKRKSYLPYRQDLVGFFANVNGMGRTFPSF